MLVPNVRLLTSRYYIPRYVMLLYSGAHVSRPKHLKLMKETCEPDKINIF